MADGDRQYRTYMKYESQTMNGYLLGYDYYLPDALRDVFLRGLRHPRHLLAQQLRHTDEPRLCQRQHARTRAWLFNWAPSAPSSTLLIKEQRATGSTRMTQT